MVNCFEVRKKKLRRKTTTNFMNNLSKIVERKEQFSFFFRLAWVADVVKDEKHQMPRLCTKLFLGLMLNQNECEPILCFFLFSPSLSLFFEYVFFCFALIQNTAEVLNVVCLCVFYIIIVYFNVHFGCVYICGRNRIESEREGDERKMERFREGQKILLSSVSRCY